MAGKWVDNEVYFGPDRRKRDGSKRWNERRQMNDAAAKPPPLGALLRRLRVRLANPPTAEEYHHIAQILNLAIAEANRQNLSACSNALQNAAHLAANRKFADADTQVVEAMARASG